MILAPYENKFASLSFILGAAEFNFSFVPYFTRFHWSDNVYFKI